MNRHNTWCQLLLALGIACCFFSARAQHITTADSLRWQCSAKIEGDFVFFTTDPLQQIYVVNRGNEVFKYSQDGQVLFQYNNNRLGPLGWIDASNPFNILLYYPDYQIAKILDRTLNPSGEFQLYQLGLIAPAALALSNDNHLWVFDETNSQLKKIGRDAEVLAQSGNLSLLLGQRPQPTQLAVSGNFIYANDPAIGILIFDAFGQYDRLIAIKDIEDFQALDAFLWYQTAQGYFWCDAFGRQSSPLTLPSSAKAVRLEKSNWFIHNDRGIEIWKKN